MLGDKRAEQLSAPRLPVEADKAALGGVGALELQQSRPLEERRPLAGNLEQEHDALSASGSAEAASSSSASDDL